MRRHRITYKDLARKLLAGNLLRRDERRWAEEILTLADSLEEGRRLGSLLERLAERGDLLRLGSPEDRPGVQRYLDPASNDHWSVELPGPRPWAGAVPPAPRAEAEEAAAEREEPVPPAQPSPAPEPPPAPRLVQAVEELDLEPSVAHRFQDESSGEPLRSLFATFSPGATPEELGESLGPIRDQVRERTSATWARFHVLESADEGLTPLPYRDEPPAPHVPLGNRVAESVLGERRTLHVPNLAAPGTDARPGDSGALVSLPLVAGGKLAGLMEVGRDTPGPFDPEELRFFALAAFIAAGVVVRAEVLEKLIYLDKLTALYNRAHFDEQIEREIERANRTNSSVALLMLDLDHFKRINDRFGHLAGDAALAHVASLIRANIRQIDAAARYGGEEFAILLPSITRARAVRTAERIRRVIAQSRLGDIVPELGDTHLSISIGIALYPDDAGTSKQLIDRADRVALYSAKNRGRNRVVSWADARETTEHLRPGA